MMKILNGSVLAGFIKERQLHQVRALRQSAKIIPKLVIIKTGNNPVIDTYVCLKKNYGEDIFVEVDVFTPDEENLIEQIKKLNSDKSIHGIIVQLPLNNPSLTDEAVNAIDPFKDVDGLGKQGSFTSATAMAINWLLVGYNIELYDKKIAIVGNGRLVGAPLYKLWKSSGFNVSVYDDKTKDLKKAISSSEIIVTATGVPGLITNEMIEKNAIVVDAGTASEHGKILGDLADEVRQRSDLTVTPEKGGVGPLTVAALFDNVITAAQNTAKK